jgi:hypothetical protein
MAGNLAKVQAELLKQKASVMKSLGLEELEAGYDTALSGAAKASRRNRANPLADADTIGMRRRSLRYGRSVTRQSRGRRFSVKRCRVKGIGPDGMPSGAPELGSLEMPSVEKFRRPEGER